MKFSNVWRNSKSPEASTKKITVNFYCGGSVAGFLFPIYMLVTGLVTKELPDEEFIMIAIEVLSIH